MSVVSARTPVNPSTYRARQAAVQEIIEREAWRGLVVLDATDVTWLTGLRSSNAAVLVTDDRVIVATDFRYVAEAEARGLEVSRIEQSMWADLGKLASEVASGGLLAYPPTALSHRAFLQFTDALGDNVNLRAIDSVISDLRVVKDADEIAAVTRASKLLEGAYQLVATCGLAGRQEGEVAWMIEQHLREAGATSLSFDSIVAGGPNGAFPHHSPSEDVIPDDTLVTVDIGCVVDSYCSDCTRTFSVGDPALELREAYDTTLSAQLAALDAVKAGASGREIDAIARDIITEAGHGDHFGHGLGHGVGMDVHEAPRLSRLSEDTLATNMLVTVEPGIYLPGLGGVRIEDLVAVTDSGCDILTHYPKQLTSA